MPPRGLSDLPEELILCILEAACKDEHPKFKLKLLLVNRQFYRLALPLLYRNLSDKSGESLKLAFTLLLDHVKANFVRSFEFYNQKDEIELRSKKNCVYTASRLIKIKHLIHAVVKYGTTKERWVGDLMERPPLWAILGLMLTQLPNLRELKFAGLGPPEDFWPFLEYVYDGLSSASHRTETGVTAPFMSLKKVKVRPRCSTSKPLAVITKWPSVQMIEGKSISDYDSDIDTTDPDPWFRDLKPRSTNFNSISLRSGSRLRTEHLVPFVGTAKALDSFDYFINNNGMSPISTPGLMRALNQHKSTLKCIVLQQFRLRWKEDSVIKSMNFSSYSALENLSIDYEFLFGDDPLRYSSGDKTRASEAEAHLVKALPESVKSLAIMLQFQSDKMHATYCALNPIFNPTGNNDSCYEATYRLPLLKSVVLAVDPMEDPSQVCDIPESHGHMRRAAKQRGVDLMQVMRDTWEEWRYLHSDHSIM